MKTNLFRKNNSFPKLGMRMMRLVLLLLPLLGRGLGGGCVLFAQNGVTVSGLAVNAGSPTTVTFNVNWQTPMPVALWSDTVWVFVDYNDAGIMKRLPLLPGATLTATSAPGVGKVIEVENNNQGVWVAGNARSAGSFSATVQLLTATADLAGACVYASNYPPVGEYKNNVTEISFTGTPMYNIVLKDNGGGTITRESGNLFSMPVSYTVQSFSDKTGAPGIMKCIVPATYTLQASALDFCAGSGNVQFALSGTEAERDYQLFRDNSAVGAVLNGTGSATTFTGSFSEAGAYTAQTVADELYCATTMNGTRMVIENPLPDNPTVPNISRECAGTVTLSASSPGAVIDWYADVAAISTLHTGASYTTPEIEISTTYYVQARVEITGCLSARVPILAEVITEGCCQELGTTGITFAKFNPCSGASYGSTYTLTDDRDQKTYKVKYMPDGRYWMVQDLMFGDCTASSFKIDNSEADTKVEPTVASGYVGHCRTCTANGDSYVYNWPAVMNNSMAYYGSSASSFACTGTGASANRCQGICPTGWHVPTGTNSGEIYGLYIAMNGATGCSGRDCWRLPAFWETASCNYAVGADCGCYYYAGKYGMQYATSSFLNNTQSYILDYGTYDIPGTSAYLTKRDGINVRCVRNY